MEPTTTHDTSIALKNAGMPQVEKYAWQKRYYYPDRRKNMSVVFAFTAIDMLQQMPSTIGTQIRLSFGGETFCVTVTKTIDGNRSETYFFNKNAAEALAEAYLYLKENETPV